jgi:hypothetical protein
MGKTAQPLTRQSWIFVGCPTAHQPPLMTSMLELTDTERQSEHELQPEPPLASGLESAECRLSHRDCVGRRAEER